MVIGCNSQFSISTQTNKRTAATELTPSPSEGGNSNKPKLQYEITTSDFASTGKITLEFQCNDTVTGFDITAAWLAEPLAASCKDNKAILQITPTGDDGEMTLTVVAIGPSKNEVLRSSIKFVKDSVPPEVSISGPASGRIANSQMQLSGLCEKGLPVSFFGDVASKTTPCNSGSYTIKLATSGLDGTRVVKASQKDLFGNQTIVTISYIKDTLPPPVPEVDVDASTPFMNGEIELDFFGVCAAADIKELQVVAGGTDPESSQWQLCSGSTLSKTLANLSNGIATVDVYARDHAGNVSDPASVKVVNLTSGTCYDNPAYITNASVTSNGSGPYVVCTLAQLQQMGSSPSSSFVLGADIIATKTNPANRYNSGSSWSDAKGWVPVGQSPRFSGDFDGANYEITGLYLNRPAEVSVGLFGTMESSNTVGAVTLSEATVNGGYTVGIFVGTALDVVIDSVMVSGDVSGVNQVGGIVGYGGYVDITSAHAVVSVSGSALVGGLAGFVESGLVELSHSEGDVVATSGFVGGLAGYLSYSDAVDSYSSSNVQTNTYFIGGLCGAFEASEVSRSFATGNIVANSFSVYSEGVGGLGGTNYGGSTFTNVYATGSIVSASDRVGGLFGFGQFVQIENSYSSNSITLTDVYSGVGGITGYSEGGGPRFIRNVFSATTITNPGGFSGGITAEIYNVTLDNTHWYNGADSDASACYSSTDSPADCTTFNDRLIYQTGTLTAPPLDTWSSSVWQPRVGKYPRLTCPAGWKLDCETTWYAAQE